MAPEEEKLTRRSPIDFPVEKVYANPFLFLPSLLNAFLSWQENGKEWERPRPGRRADIFPQFSPMKTPLPPPMPADPPEEDEEEEEKREKEGEGEGEEDPNQQQ
ncbi:hypothetical protein TSUD_261730 [Trifolium subterraneum]|nr:hypothetical protein TSUD_261730 [Trifolium subterraneum]